MLMANNIENLMAERGLTVYRLAKITGLTYPGVKKLASADTIPDATQYDTLKRISKALGVRIEDLETENSDVI